MEKHHIPYLKSPWSCITREERYYCSHLYHSFKCKPHELVKFIQKSNHIIQDKKSGTSPYQSSPKSWELAFEVCFYRDYLFSEGIRVRGDAAMVKEKYGIEDPSKLIKRTFDLCLFGDKDIIVIEAKCHEGLTRKQLKCFKEDKEYLSKIIGHKNKDVAIHLIILASSNYYDSKSFTLKNGIGKQLLSKDNYGVSKMISWLGFAADSDTLDDSARKVLKAADDSYNSK